MPLPRLLVLAAVGSLALGAAGCSKLTSPTEFHISKEERATRPRMADAAVGDPAGADGRAVALRPPPPTSCGAVR